MTTNNLESMLSEYEEKRRKAEMDAENRKIELYEQYPELEEIENNINKLAISKTKAILSNQKNLQNIDIEISELKNKKNKFFKEKNIDSKMLEPKYECEKCKDTGYIFENGKTQMCSCLKQKILNLSYNMSNLSDIKKENFSKFNLNLFSDVENSQKYKLKCSPRNNIKNIKSACENFIENFDNLEEKNLLFVGNTGLGKTFMSNCIANELLQKGKTVLYQTAPVLLETIINNKFNNKSDDFYKNVLSVDLLIIDDLGTENINSMTVSELFTILNTRLLNLNNKPTKTIISTNLSIQQIFNLYEERIGSRIAGFYNIYQFIGEDLRISKNYNK